MFKVFISQCWQVKVGMNRLAVLLLSSVLILVSLHAEVNAATVPDAPSGLTVTAVSPTQINLFWSTPNDGQSSITGYKIEYRVGSGSYSVLVSNTASTSTTYSHTGLTTDQTYTYHVYAINSIGTSASSSEVSATPTSTSSGTNPGAPTGLTAVPASPTQVNLSWSAPSNNGGYQITGYRIEYRVGSSSYTTLVSNTGSLSTAYSHTGLTTGQVYIYRVFTITSFGTSVQPSTEAVAQPQSSSALTVPGAPTGLTAVPVSPTQVNLSWTTPSNNGGSAISGYKIESKSGSGSYSVLVSNTASTSTIYSHTGLVTGTVYTYKVSAVNSIGTGTTSSEVSATPTSSSSATVPSAPTSLIATSVSSTQNNLSWSAPSNNGGYQITGYKIEYRIGSGSYSVLVSNTASTSTAYSHTGLSAGQTYVYRVSAINSIGTSSASAESSTTPSSSNTPSAPTGFTAVTASPTQVNLSWSPPSNNGGSAITGYKIEVKKGTGSYETLVANTASTATSFIHTGLTKGTIYYYRVSAINSVGTGPSSDASATPKETTAPALTAIAVSPTSITLSWVPPSQTYKQQITGYKIDEKIGPDAYKTISENTGSTVTTYSITGLTTGKPHTYVVSAFFTLGASPFSNEASATPLSTSAPPQSQSNVNPPGTPTGLAATSASPTTINLSWSAPSNTGGSAITGYKIEVKKNPGQFETLTSSTQNSTTKYSHTGLTTGATYVYRVYAINSVGISSPSAEASAIPSAVSAHPPGAPTLTINHNANQANLRWSSPSNDGGAPITGYKIEYKIGSGSYMTLITKATGTSYSHTGLLANTYSYRVYAVNSAGTGAPSNEVSVVVAAPTKPTTPTVPEETETPTEEPKQEGPKTNIPGFPDPARDPQYYVDRYNNEPEFAAWFDKNFPGESIYDVVGATDPSKKEVITTHIPGFPDPAKDSEYYIYLYKNEPSFKAWFDENFQDQTIYALFGVPEPEPVQDATKCGTGTHLEGGVCVLDAEKGGGCLVATAAYGTELSSQVQLLREIRDNVLLNTDSGTTFMAGFNQFYYLFSPTVADLERQSPVFKEIVKVAMLPMLSTMPILNNAGSESEVAWYGMGIILLNAGIYLGIPIFSILAIKNRSKIQHFKSQRQ
ncbi:hypothetical protein DSQ19_04450 [Candidatus Nitrosotenuis sp. DW1]|nr:hypothetical protein DSQ19_04450 [Candidatus Nitrosotenuis sp. DW1]